MKRLWYCIKPRKFCKPFPMTRKYRFYQVYIHDRKIKFYRWINRKDIAWAEKCIKQFQEKHMVGREWDDWADGYNQGFLRALQIFTKR